MLSTSGDKRTRTSTRVIQAQKFPLEHSMSHDLILLERLPKRTDEDNFVERKPQSVKAHELRQTLVAFSNSVRETETAVLFLGVHDKTGAILGIDDSDNLQKRVGEAGDDCYPPIQPRMTVLHVEGKRILAVEIECSRSKPHFAGPAYVRSGSRSVKASEALYRDLLSSHCGKAGEILKWKGRQVTVRTVHKRLGNHYPNLDHGQRKTYTCTVVECDPFNVTLKLQGYGDELCVEPLRRIEVDWDPAGDRRMLIVSGESV
jgi:hypothetical protein